MPTSPEDLHIPTGGRVLQVVTAGPPEGVPLVLHHGTPGAALLFAPLVDAATERGLRSVTYSRPGYETSAPAPGRRVADAAADTAAVLDALGANRFVTVGWSGGGPHALACAALLPERCAGAVSLAGVAPYRAEGLDWMAGMGPENVEEFSVALRGEAELTPWLAKDAQVFAHVTGSHVAEAFGGLVAPVDVSSLTSSFAEYLAEMFRKALAPGVAGWRDDDLAFLRDWGFDLAAMTTPVAVWQGTEDRMVPYAHGVWLASHLPGARRHLYDGEGHLSLWIGAWERILDDLLDLAGLG